MIYSAVFVLLNLVAAFAVICMADTGHKKRAVFLLLFMWIFLFLGGSLIGMAYREHGVPWQLAVAIQIPCALVALRVPLQAIQDARIGEKPWKLFSVSVALFTFFTWTAAICIVLTMPHEVLQRIV